MCLTTPSNNFRILMNIIFDQAYFETFPTQGSSSQVRSNA